MHTFQKIAHLLGQFFLPLLERGRLWVCISFSRIGLESENKNGASVFSTDFFTDPANNVAVDFPSNVDEIVYIVCMARISKYQTYQKYIYVYVFIVYIYTIQQRI